MARFGVARLTDEYDKMTQSVTSAASDVGKGLDDLMQHAARFATAFSVTRRSDAALVSSKQLTLSELLEKKRGILSMHEAFANMHNSERMRFVSAHQWLGQVKNSAEYRVEGNFIVSDSLSALCASTAEFIGKCERGASLIHLCTSFEFDMPVAKEIVNRLLRGGQIAVDESIEGVRFYSNRF